MNTIFTFLSSIFYIYHSHQKHASTIELIRASVICFTQLFYLRFPVGWPWFIISRSCLCWLIGNTLDFFWHLVHYGLFFSNLDHSYQYLYRLRGENAMGYAVGCWCHENLWFVITISLNGHIDSHQCAILIIIFSIGTFQSAYAVIFLFDAFFVMEYGQKEILVSREVFMNPHYKKNVFIKDLSMLKLVILVSLLCNMRRARNIICFVYI